MGAPVPEMNPVEDSTAEALLGSLKSIPAAERRKHASVFNYWLSIRGNKPFPPIRDLDPLEISDAGPFSLLLEMIGGGEDATIRHIGQAIRSDSPVESVAAAPVPSLLACIHSKLPIVASSRQAFAFEDEFETEAGPTRCWVTLLPFSATGTWIDYVYGFVSLDPAPGAEATGPAPEQAVVEAAPEPGLEPEPEPEPEPEAEPEVEAVVEEAGSEPEVEASIEEPEPEPEPSPEPDARAAEAVSDELGDPFEPPATGPAEPEAALPAEEADAPARDARPGFSTKLFDKLAGVSGFYGRVVEVEPTAVTVAPPPEPVFEREAEPIAEPEPGPVAELEPEPRPVPAAQFAAAEPAAKPPKASEGPLQTKLAEVRAKADEARMAKLRSNLALYEGLSAAYDFALDAEENAEEYLKLVEEQGLKIQLRSPMKPVVKLAFDGLCDEATIAQLEAVLAWALKQDLPRGSLAERIEAEGGLGPILNGFSKAA